MSGDNSKELNDILKRLDRLEKFVFPKKKAAPQKPNIGNDFSGPKGGVLLLISKNFFSRQRTAAQVLAELKVLGYMGYQRQVIQNALNRLSTNKGPLIASTEGGVRMYAKRK